MESIQRSRIIRKGTLTFILRGIAMLAKIVLLVLIVQRVGRTGYGVYTLLLYLPQQFNIFEAGLGTFITRELSAKTGAAKDGEFDSLLSTGALSMLLIGGISTLLTWIALFTFFDAWFLPPDIAADVAPAKHLAAISFLLVFGNMYCQRIMTGLHAFETARTISLLTTVAQIAAVAWLVFPEADVALNVNRLAAIWTAASFLSFAASWVIWRRLMPCAAHISLRSVRRSAARDSAGFAWPLIASKCLGIAMSKIDVWIVAAALGPANVAVLDIAKRLSVMASTLVTELSSTVFPFASRLVSTEPDRIRAFIRDGTYYVFSISAALCVGVAAVAPGAILVFMGEDFRGSIPLLWLFLLGTIINNLSSCGTQVWLSMGLYRHVLVPFTIGAIIAIALQLALVGTMNEMGVVLGVTIGMTVRTIGLLVTEEKTLPGGVMRPLAGLWRPLLFLAPAFAAAILMQQLRSDWSFPEFVIAATAWSAIIAIGLAVFVLQKDDRTLLINRARRFLQNSKPKTGN